MYSARDFVLFACVAGAAACGGKIASDSTTSAPDVIVEPGTPLPAPRYVNGCPSSAPPIGGACSVANVVCEYGSDPNPACDVIVGCGGAVGWVAPVGLPKCVASAQSSDHHCPSPYPPDPRSKTSCAGDVGVVCDYRYPLSPPATGYARVECACHDDAKLGPIWDCANIITDANCPFPPPLLGTVCTTEGLSCPMLAHFEGWTCVPMELCSHGGWTLQACK